MIKQQYIYSQALISKAEKMTFEKIDSFKVMQRAAKACYLFILKNLNNTRTPWQILNPKYELYPVLSLI